MKGMIVETPAHQVVDLIPGRDQGIKIPPVMGWIVTAPDSRIDAEMFTNLAEAEAHVDLVKRQSKWPDVIFARPCWIHKQEGFHDDGSRRIGKRRHWTPR
jgi:hypothetical protein